MDDVVAMLNRNPKVRQMDELSLTLTQNVYSSLPYPTVATAAPLSAAAVAWEPDDGAHHLSRLPRFLLEDILCRLPCDEAAAYLGGVDHFNRLPRLLLYNILSRLPVKDAVRTTVLSRRWSRIWHEVPLVLVDAHLTPSSDLVCAVARVLDAHPGPFNAVHLTGTPENVHPLQMERVLNLLASKHVKHLVLLNQPTKIDEKVKADLPSTIFQCNSLRLMYIGYLRFPDTSRFLPGSPFPNLRELGLCGLLIQEVDLNYMLDGCPLLQKVMVVGTHCTGAIRLQSRSIRCIQVCSCVVTEIVVGPVGELERLMLWEARCTVGVDNMSFTINLNNASKLRVMGFLVPGLHKLVIGNQPIKAWSPASPNTTVPSVTMLAIWVDLGAQSKIMHIPAYLRCFPNIDTLYIQCQKYDSDTRIRSNFWEDTAGPAECIRKHLKKVVLRGLSGKKSEIQFLKFLIEKAKALQKMQIVVDPDDYDAVRMQMLDIIPSRDQLDVHITTDGNDSTWCYIKAFDLSNTDPFDLTQCRKGKCLRGLPVASLDGLWRVRGGFEEGEGSEEGQGLGWHGPGGQDEVVSGQLKPIVETC